MRRFLWIGSIVATVACGPPPTTPTPEPIPQPVPALRIVADPVVDMTPGEIRALQIEAADASGHATVRRASEYTWQSSHPGIITIDQAGVLRAGQGLGEALITAESPAGIRAQVRVWVQLPDTMPSTFRITLVYAEDVPEGWHQVFRSAADRWQRVIRASLSVLMASAAQGQAPPAISLKPYSLETSGGPVSAEVGRLQVPERRMKSNPESRPINIAFVRIPSTSASPGAPVVYLDGGPGGSGFGAARVPALWALFDALRKNADIILLVHHRGKRR